MCQSLLLKLMQMGDDVIHKKVTNEKYINLSAYELSRKRAIEEFPNNLDNNHQKQDRKNWLIHMIMDSVEENGSNIAPEQISNAGTTSIVHLISPQSNPSVHQAHVQSSVIQPNQQSVIQTATGNIQPVKSVLLVNSKPNSVIHTTQAIQIKPEPNIGHAIDTDDSDLSDDDSPKKRRDLLTRRPSYRKILNDLGGGEIGGGMLSSAGNPNDHGSLQGTGGTIVQYSNQDGNLVSYVPVNLVGNNVIAEDQSRKREMRLLKNREAARECRRKKKEYIKCLENRVAVLENQNKALIEELKSLKELYCQQKNE